jgi:UDP-N-acetylmuramate dehydrogenase
VSTVALDRAVAEAAAVLGERGHPDAPFGALTTYRVGGRAALLLRAEGVDDLRLAQRAIAASGLAVLVVGKGSNLLVADAGFPGLVVLLGDGLATVDVTGTVVHAGGAAALPVVARRSVAEGLTGFEWAVGVPGSVGGAVRMNAGGHGSDVAASLVDIRVFDLRSGEDGSMAAAQLGLRFRGSDLRDHQVVVGARFALAPGSREVGEAALSEIVHWRRAHQPGGQNAGSVFVNPVPGEVAAGALIDGLGLRGRRLGTARVSEKHANFIQADDGGSADDVRALMEVVRAKVHAAHGVRLRTEIRMVGFDEARWGAP